MQLSKETLDILKNFSMINQQIIIREGNQITTHSTERGQVIATATVNETFPVEFGVYELNRLISSIALVEDSELQFNDTHLIIKGNKSRLKFMYSDKGFLQFRSDISPPELSYVETFNITNKDIVTLRKSAGTLNLDSIRILGRDGKLYMRSGSKDSKDEYSIDLGKETEHEFEIVYPLSRIQCLMSLDYEVSLERRGFARFKNDRVTYWIAPNNETKHGTLI